MDRGNERERIRKLEAKLAQCSKERIAAKRAESLLQLFRDSAEDYAFITLDMENRIVDWSRGAERILGYAKEEVLGSSGSIFFTPEDILDGELDRELQLAKSRGRAEDECWHQRKDGSRFWGSGVMAALRDAEGRQIGYAKVFRDLTAGKQIQDRLTASLREKDVLLREIHHRVKNNLQVITSLISLQARASKHPDMQDVFDELQSRVRAVAALHEGLYSSPDLGNILFGAYMEQLLQELLAFHAVDPRRVSLDVAAADVVISIEQALPLGLILNELITNCLKHAFPEQSKGRIKVRLDYVASNGEEGPQECELSVSDDGIGMSTGNGLTNTQSMGLHIVDLLASELRGKLEMSQDQQRGTKFTLRFPLTEEEAKSDSQTGNSVAQCGRSDEIGFAAALC